MRRLLGGGYDWQSDEVHQQIYHTHLQMVEPELRAADRLAQGNKLLTVRQFLLFVSVLRSEKVSTVPLLFLVRFWSTLFLNKHVLSSGTYDCLNLFFLQFSF